MYAFQLGRYIFFYKQSWYGGFVMDSIAQGCRVGKTMGRDGSALMREKRARDCAVLNGGGLKRGGPGDEWVGQDEEGSNLSVDGWG